MTERLQELIAKLNLPLQLVNSKEKGRYLVSTAPIAQGEIIFREFPFVSVVHEPIIQKVCNYCFDVALRSEHWDHHCQSCNRVYYCSKECQAKEIELHSLECGVLQKLDIGSFSIWGFESIKIVIRLFKIVKANTPRVGFRTGL